MKAALSLAAGASVDVNSVISAHPSRNTNLLLDFLYDTSEKINRQDDLKETVLHHLGKS